MSDNKREKEPKKAGVLIIEQIIGKRPKKPASYNIRKADKKNKAHQDFCKKYDQELAEWEKKAAKLRADQKSDQTYEDYVEPVNPKINVSFDAIYVDFKLHYKHLYKKEFNPKNPYSPEHEDEPEVFLKTLIYYFLRDDRFFKSPLLRKDLSVPSFEKGIATIGISGCGKTSVFYSLLSAFKVFVKGIRNSRPSNLDDLLRVYDIGKCEAKEIASKCNAAKDRGVIGSILLPLKHQRCLLIDDLLREEVVQKYGEVSVFKDVLGFRFDREEKYTHITLNYWKYLENGQMKFLNTKDTIMKFIEKYDERVWDRFYGRQNIIELKGKTFRR